MKSIRIATVIIIAVLLYACGGTNTAGTTTDKSGNIVKGETFEAKNVIAYDDFLNQLEGKDSLRAVVRGKVESVCQVKGCWMNIVSDMEGKEEMFVKFKDYGFFMPLDLEGEVIMNGIAYREITSVDELRHYAEDEGKSKEEIEAITEPQVELKFMASGVIIENKQIK